MIPFVGPAYALKTRKADVERSINLMPTVVESGAGKAAMFLQSIPGLDTFSPAPVITTLVDIDLNAITNAGINGSNGIVVDNLDEHVTYTLSMPPGRIYTAWQPNASEGFTNAFAFKTFRGITKVGDPLTQSSTAELARLAFAGYKINGFTSYTFFIYDTPVVDNIGGISLRLSS